MRPVAILALALLAIGCQGPSLGDAVAHRDVAEAKPTPEEAPKTPQGFDAFLGKASEGGPTPVADMDRAIDTVLDAKARARARSPGPEVDACNRDGLDAFAGERGLSREAARQLYKNRKYTKSEKTVKPDER